MEHLFFGCEIIQDIWKSLHDLISSSSINMSFQDIQVGVILKNKKSEFLVNNSIILTKYYIHKCRYAKSPPSWTALKNEISLFQQCLKHINTPLAVKLYTLITTVNLS